MQQPLREMGVGADDVHCRAIHRDVLKPGNRADHSSQSITSSTDVKMSNWIATEIRFLWLSSLSACCCSGKLPLSKAPNPHMLPPLRLSVATYEWMIGCILSWYWLDTQLKMLDNIEYRFNTELIISYIIYFFQHLPPHIDFLFLELHIPFSLTQDSLPVSEKHNVIYSNTVDGIPVFSLPGILTKKRRRTIQCSWLDHNCLCKEDG